MLLVTIGYCQKGGVSKSRVGEILGLEASFILDDLLAADAIGFAGSRPAVPHRHPGAQPSCRDTSEADSFCIQPKSREALIRCFL